MNHLFTLKKYLITVINLFLIIYMKPSRVINKHTIRTIRKIVQKPKEMTKKETSEELQQRRALYSTKYFKAPWHVR